MKKTIILTILTFNILLSQELNYEGKLGYFLELSTNIKYNNAKESINILTNDIVKKINSKIEVSSFFKYKDIKKAFLENELDIMIIRIEDYLKDYKSLDKYTHEFLIFPKTKAKRLDNLYLISNKKEKNLFSKNKKILLQEKDKLSLLFLEKLYLKENKKLDKKDIFYLEKYNTIFLKVYFREYDFAIVPRYIYELMLELNPAIAKKIYILKKSPAIYNTNILLLRKNSKNKLLKEKLNEFVKIANNSMLYEALRVENLKYLKKDEIKNLKSFYLEYLKLKK